MSTIYILNYLVLSILYFEIQNLGIDLINVLPTKLGMKERSSINKKLEDFKFKKKLFLLWPALVLKDIYEKVKKRK